MKTDSARDWALGIGAAVFVMAIALVLIIVTKPAGWSLGHYAMGLTGGMALLTVVLRKVQRRRF
jgi:hypothetical protein